MASFKFFMPYRMRTRAVKSLPQIDDGGLYTGFREIGELFKEGFNVHGRVHCVNVEIFSRIKEYYSAVIPDRENICPPKTTMKESVFLKTKNRR